MTAGLVTPPLVVAIVMYGFAGIIVGCAIAITIGKGLRDLRRRLTAPVRERFAGLPSAVALDDEPPPAPASGRARRVARDLVIDATFALEGDARRRAVGWLEANGYVTESILQFERPRWRGTRPATALRLGRMGSSDAAPTLARGLRDGSYRVRDACATALGRVATTTEVAELVAAVSRRDVPRGILSNALLQLRVEADPELIACLDHPDAETRELIAQVLGLRRSVSAADALLRLVADPAAPVRRAAVLALADIAGNTDVRMTAAPLLQLARDDAPIVRSAAATSLGTILGDAAGPVLAALCRDPDYWVSHRAAESLCRLPSGADLGWRVLAALDDSPEGRQAKAACLEWLERTGGLEDRLEDIMRRRDDAELLVTLAVLEEVGSRAWGDLFAKAPPNAGIPTNAVAA